MALAKYKAPEFEIVAKKAYELPFNGSVGATAQLTFVSSMIAFQFKVTTIKIYFSNNHANGVRHYFLVGRNSQGSTTGIPEGDNMFGQISPSNYHIGDNETIVLHPYALWEEARGYIKVHINNLNAYAVAIKVIIVIEEI